MSSFVGRRFANARIAQLQRYDIAVVLPAYNEAGQIIDTLRALPDYVRHVVVVDDCSRDATADIVANYSQSDPRVVLVRHALNQGVGGAMVTGFQKALELGAQLVVKMDADGQMPVEFLPDLLLPLILGEADYAKGNRFRDFDALRQMPALRRAGNMALSFLTKAAVGYWNCFDPCNGYVAIRGELLAHLPLEKVQRSYFFETSMLAQLYLMGACVADVPMPARYGAETSSLSIRKVLTEFPRRLAGCLLRRLVLRNFIYDFTMESVYLLASLPLLMAGVLYGGLNWLSYARAGGAAPTGTVVISALLITMGFQLLLSAISEDLRAVPDEPLCDGPLQPAIAESQAPPLARHAVS